MYLAEINSKNAFIPSSFPGSIVRRHTGTPFVGYAGATYILQEFCNSLFDSLFHVLPLGTELDLAAPITKTKSLKPKAHSNVRWEKDAENVLNKYLEKEPILVQISRAKKLREQLEMVCKERGLLEITEFMVMEYLNLNSERSEIQNAEEKV
jgi:chlorophyllide a reductase subunit Z